MSTLRSNAVQKRKDSVRNCTRSEEYEISSTGLQIDLIRCSGCDRIPDKEIYNCLDGHLICDICKQGNDICSRKDCTKVLVRSSLAEKFLAQITFKCPWTKLGCNEADIKRHELTLHQKICKHNPNFLTCSHLFINKCEYQFCTVSVDDEDAIKDMKEHFISHEKEMSVTDTIFGSTKKEENFNIGNLNIGIYVSEVLDWSFGGDPLGTIMVIWMVEEDVCKIKTIARYFVSLAEDHKMTSKYEVQLTIKSQPKPESGLARKCIPNLKWPTTVLNTREFSEVLRMTPQQRQIKHFYMPIFFLQSYYVNAKGEINLEYFGSSVVLERQEKRQRTLNGL